MYNSGSLNSNKWIAKNVVMLYIRMFVTIAVGFAVHFLGER